MTGEGWAAIILALGTFLTVVTNTIIAFAGLRKSAGNSVKIIEASDKITEASAKITETSAKVDETSVKLDEVKKATDGLSTTAQNEARTAGQAVGEAKGRADAVAEQGADALARERGLPPRQGP